MHPAQDKPSADVRGEFEAWMSGMGGDVERPSAGEYALAQVESAWRGWQAATLRGRRVPMSRQQLSDACREAQIAYCLGKFKTYDEALAHRVEAHHNIQEPRHD